MVFFPPTCIKWGEVVLIFMPSGIISMYDSKIGNHVLETDPHGHSVTGYPDCTCRNKYILLKRICCIVQYGQEPVDATTNIMITIIYTGHAIVILFSFTCDYRVMHTQGRNCFF